MSNDTSVSTFENIRLTNLISSRNNLREVIALLHLLQNNFHYECSKGESTWGPKTYSVSNSVKHFPKSGHDGILLTATVVSLSNEEYTDFSRRSTFFLSSFCNTYVIPVFLLHAIGYAQSVGMDWHRLVKISWERVETEVVHGDISASDFFMHKNPQSPEIVDFFLVAGEVLNRYVMQTSSNVHSVTLHLLLSEELFAPESTKSFSEQGHERAIELMSKAMQFLPIYRSILACRSSNYGITLAPYNMGVGCGLVRPADQQKPTKQEVRPYTFVYGHWAEDIHADSIFMSSRHVYCGMTSLHDIDIKKAGIDPLSIPQILPYTCILLNPTECSSPLLLKALRARGFVFQETPNIDSNCALLDIIYNPIRPTDSPASSVKQLSAYLILLVASCTKLIGKNARVMAYVSFEKVIDDELIRVIHILDMGTPPKTKVSRSNNVYKHSGSKSMLCDVEPNIDSQPESDVVDEKIPSLQDLATYLRSLFSGANENFRRQYYCLTRRSSVPSDIDSYLSGNKVKVRIVTQECHPRLLSLPAPLHQSQDQQDSSSDSELLDAQDSTVMYYALQSTMPMADQEPEKLVTSYARSSVADSADISVSPISSSTGNVATNDESAPLDATQKLPQSEALQKSDVETLQKRRVTFDPIEAVHLYDAEDKSPTTNFLGNSEQRFSWKIFAALKAQKSNVRNVTGSRVPHMGSGRFAPTTQPEQEGLGDEKAPSAPVRPNPLPLYSQSKAVDSSPISEKRDIKNLPMHESGASCRKNNKRRAILPVTIALSLLSIVSTLCIVVPLYLLLLKSICAISIPTSQCDAALIIFCSLFIFITTSVTLLCEHFLFVRNKKPLGPLHDNDNGIECDIDNPRSTLIQADTKSELGTDFGHATR